MKADILPIGITGCEEYNWIPFKGKLKIAIGEPISYNQELDDIINEWGRKVSELINYSFQQDIPEIDNQKTDNLECSLN